MRITALALLFFRFFLHSSPMLPSFRVCRGFWATRAAAAAGLVDTPSNKRGRGSTFVQTLLPGTLPLASHAQPPPHGQSYADAPPNFGHANAPHYQPQQQDQPTQQQWHPGASFGSSAWPQ